MSDLNLCVLGPLEVRRAGQQVTLGGKTTMTLLAGLAVAPHRAISVDTLIDYVWDGTLPDHPRAALHNGMSRLRRVLGADILETLGWGYRLRAGIAELDLLRFDMDLAVARQAMADCREGDALVALDDAIALWREPVLGNIESTALHREVVPRLTDRYLEAVEWRADLCLRCGRTSALAEELAVVVRAYPLRERLTGQLMTALARAGRRADAIVAYNSLRRSLREELGIDPPADLRDLHVKLLRADHVLDLA